MRILLLVLALVLVGCPKQAPNTSGTLPSGSVKDPELRRVLDTALSLHGQTKVVVKGKPFRSDCSGFVTACWYAAPRALITAQGTGSSGTEQIFTSLQRKGRIVAASAVRPGDLAFFHNTHDRNRNGARDDRFTHVALVERVDVDGTVHYTHFASGKVKRGVLNPRQPNTPRDPDSGKTWNSYLRRGGGKVLAGQLLHRFGRP